jgi:dipeptidase E
MSRLLLISNSTVHGKGYPDHVEVELQDFVGKMTKIVFAPFALYDRLRYANQVEARLNKMGLESVSIYNVSNPLRAIQEAEVIFVGGGNTFRLLKGLYDWNLMERIRQAVAAFERGIDRGLPFVANY